MFIQSSIAGFQIIIYLLCIFLFNREHTEKHRYKKISNATVVMYTGRLPGADYRNRSWSGFYIWIKTTKQDTMKILFLREIHFGALNILKYSDKLFELKIMYKRPLRHFKMSLLHNQN